ncbi:E3 SUMO-protein ligase KIAA1586-like [Amia ocellicauda]|uniref:E3 SUMO-protein ligase KIAA1586-like n=1 Tax=Amia ocellicauda TaxID=2972642 RepID=UPI0034639D7A
MAEQQKEVVIENAVEAMTDSYMKETEAVFRTAYHLAKKNRPFSDHESLIELQELNGIKMGSILHSRYSATQITKYVANEMQSKIVSSIIASSSMNHRLELHYLSFSRCSYPGQLTFVAIYTAGHFTKAHRVLDVRWVASSFRTVRAVWTSLGALVQHFKNACSDERRSNNEKQMYRGLLDRVQSPEFLCDLGLMYDTLHELSVLSQELQARSITLRRAEHLLKRRVLH